MSYSIRAYRQEDFLSLYQAFGLAFSSGYVSIQLSQEHFRIRLLQKLNLKAGLSTVCIDNSEKVLGFNLHTSSMMAGKHTAYNGGIGVVPDYHRQGIARKMYERAIHSFEGHSINRVLLEVVTTNKPAIEFYRSLGFQFRRRFKCFKLNASVKSKANSFVIQRGDVIPDSHFDFEPAYLDNIVHLIHNLPNEVILVAKQENTIQGFVVFQPHMGRMSQWFVQPQFRRMGVGKALIQEVQKISQKALTIMNVPEDQFDTISAIEKLGFRNELDQFEMELII